MRILLVRVANDRLNLAAWTYEGLAAAVRKNAFVAPLALATLAALTPDDIEVRIWDEHLHGPATDFKGFDFVGITAFSSQMPRACALSATVRAAGVRTIVGGPGATAAPEKYRDDFDVIFVGEAEQTWPQFLADLRSAQGPRKEYRGAALPDLALSPPPRWDSIAADLPRYVSGSVQISRGCPFTCEFCGVWQTFGRKMRTKSIEQVLAEVRTMSKLGVHGILLASDNFYGAPKYAKEVLRALLAHNRSLKWPIMYNAEVDIGIARDDEFLALLADAHFTSLLIGIETPNKASLAEVRKRQNLRGDLLANIQHVQSFGIPIDGSVIVGFDHDTPEIFDEMFNFLQESRMPIPRLHILKAIPGTDLYRRFAAEGRVIETEKVVGPGVTEYVDAVLFSNIVPVGMTRAELVAGYGRLAQRVFAWDAFAERVMALVEGARRRPQLLEEQEALWYDAMMSAHQAHLPPGLAGRFETLIAEVERKCRWMVPVAVHAVIRYTFEVRRVAEIVAATEQQLAAMGSRAAVAA